MFRGKLKFLLGFILLVMIVIAGYVLYLYQKCSKQLFVLNELTIPDPQSP